MNSGQCGHNGSVTTMTPEQLNELADEIQSAHECILLEGDLLEEVIIALREGARALTCAKAEPVAVISSVLSGGHVLDYKYDVVNRLPVGTKLYIHPPKQEQSPEVAPTTVAEVISKTTDTIVPDAKDEIDHDGIWTNSDVAEQRYIQGWNDCRAAMQANCDAMLKGEK